MRVYLKVPRINDRAVVSRLLFNGYEPRGVGSVKMYTYVLLEDKNRIHENMYRS